MADFVDSEAEESDVSFRRISAFSLVSGCFKRHRNEIQESTEACRWFKQPETSFPPNSAFSSPHRFFFLFRFSPKSRTSWNLTSAKSSRKSKLCPIQRRRKTVSPPPGNLKHRLDVFVVVSDDEDKIREELKDLIDDAPLEDDESDADSEASGRNAKRKKSDDDDDELDDRLEDEDYELIEENLGVKVDRVSQPSPPFQPSLTFPLPRNASSVSNASPTRNPTTRKNATKPSTAKFSPKSSSPTRTR
jgi:hypothetical protein